MRPLHPSTCFSLPLLIQVLSTFIFHFFSSSHAPEGFLLYLEGMK